MNDATGEKSPVFFLLPVADQTTYKDNVTKMTGNSLVWGQEKPDRKTNI